MAAEKLLFVLRHGERADRAPLSRQPASFLPYDPPLTALGVTQAERSADLILSHCPSGEPIHIVCSPFYRTLMTAAALARRVSVPIHVQDGFGEWLYSGDFTDSPMDKLHSQRVDLSEELGVQIVQTTPLARASFPESHSAMLSRVRGVYQRYLTEVTEPVLVIVTHATLVEVVSELWTGRSCGFSEDYYCTLSHAVLSQRGYQVKLLGTYKHAPQSP